MNKRKGIFFIISVFVIMGMFGIAWAADNGYQFIIKWGSIGSGDGQFMAGPIGLAVDSLGYVYVGGGANGSIQKFTSDGIFVNKWGYLLVTLSIAVDTLDNIYVSDNSHIQKFDPDGTFLDMWSASGIGENQYLSAQGIAVDSSGNIYIVDTIQHKVLKFTNDGNFMTKWGYQGTGEGQFYAPTAIAIDPLGYVYVADYGNNRIQKFTSAGNFVTSWSPGEFYYPVGIASDKVGNVYVVSPGSNRIKKFSSSGTFIIDWDAQDTGSRPFEGLRFIAVDSSGNVYVTENGGYYIQKFAPRISSPSAPTSLSAKTTSASNIVLTWKDNSDNEAGFKIYRKEEACDSSSLWSLIATKEASVKTHTNAGLTANTTYSYRVRAYNASGNSSYSNCASAKTALSGTPKAATNLTATSTSLNRIKLIWKDNSTDEKSFKVYRKIGSGSWGLLATKGANVVSHTDTTALGNTSTTKYSYYLQACNGNGCSPKTNTAIVPYKPTNLSATAVSSSRINLTWTDKSNNESGFQIYRKTGVCSFTNSWSRIKTTGRNITSYSNTGLTSGATYSYKIRAYKKSLAMPYAYGYSSYSNCKNATTP